MMHIHDALKSSSSKSFSFSECDIGKLVKFVKFNEKVVAIIRKYFTYSIVKEIKIEYKRLVWKY